MKKEHAIAVSAAALLVGALLGHYVPPMFNRPADEPAAPAKASEKRSDRARSPQPNHVADLNRLRARIRDLERQLAERTDAAAVTEENVEAPATNRVEGFRPFGGPPSAAEMRARFEEMREKDPERYAQITNNMARWQSHRQERLQNQFDILASADTKHMTKAQRKVHEDYTRLLARQEELFELMNPNNTDVTDAQRDAAGKELRETWRQLHDLQRAERDTLLTQTANALGYKGQDAKEVVDAIKAVYEATGGGHHGPPPGRPGGNRRGGGANR